MTGQPMIAVKAPRAKARTRNRLMASGAMGMAIGALMLAPQMARAQVTAPGGQSFQGNAQVVSGGATVVQSATQDTITVTTPQAVINWTPNDRTGTGTIDFLPEGLRGLFTGDADFTVLNRIIPLDGSDIPVARMIALNGIIDSQVGGQQGGNVWFYSPGGILIGGTSIINVGSLLLTSRDIDTTGGLFGPGETIRFRNPSIAGANGQIEVDVLARINARNATPGSAYVAMVAPRVVQAGTVRSDGAIALVAAEEVDIRINRGLFDIVVTTGTSDPNGIVHTGSSTGPSDTSTQFENRAYLVAVPKNQALTMLLSGTIGFETASSVSIDANGGILLSAGGNILQGALIPPPPTTGIGNISISDSRFANNFGAVASGTIVARPNQSCAPLCSATTPAGQLLFGGNATFAAANGVSISVGQAQRMTVGGNLLILSARPGQGGSASLTIDNAAPPTTSTSGGGVIQVAGTILLDASAGGHPVTGAATGGTASLSVNGGTLSAAAISVRASAVSRVGSTGDGADATGGSASVTVENAGQLTTGALSVAANGTSNGVGRDVLGNPFVVANGGDGRGGTATLVVDNASLTAVNSLDVSASGNGGIGSVTSGDGFGGTASISVDDDGGPTSLSSASVNVFAIGQGGGSGFDPSSQGFFTTRDGGDGAGGRASFAASDTAVGTVDLGSLRVDASATGGSAFDSTNPPLAAANGGNAQGGIATFALTGAAANASIDALSVFGNASGGSSVSSLGTGGNGTGGSSSFSLASGATLDSQFNIVVQSSASGGDGLDVSGDGTGGSTSVDIAAGSTLNGAVLYFSATGLGGGYTAPFQSFSPTTNVGGNGRGGLVTVSTAGTVQASSVEFDANGYGGSSNPSVSTTPGLRGGDGTGGDISFQQTGGSFDVTDVVAMANGTGGGSGTAEGITGSGTGGSTSFTVSGGLAQVELDFRLEALGLVNLAGQGIVSDLLGGSTSLSVNGGTLEVGETIDLNAGAGGSQNASSFAATGNATGGNALVQASNGGTISAFELIVTTTALGVDSFVSAGSATGGIVELIAESGGGIFASDSSQIGASGLGGSSFLAGSGTGGSIDVTIDGGTVSLLGFSNINATGRSGASFDDSPSPAARGGSLNIRLTDNVDSRFVFRDLNIGADGDFDSGISSASAVGPGGNFGNGPADTGDATGGSISLTIEGGTVTGVSLLGSASGYATSGGTGTGGNFTMDMTGGAVTINDFQILLHGIGGTSVPDFDDSDTSSISGDGVGGTALLTLTGGTLAGDRFAVSAGGYGGLGVSGAFDTFGGGEGSTLSFSGIGGDGFGGSIEVLIDGTVTVNTGFLAFGSDGIGGDGGGFITFDGTGTRAPGAGGSGTGGFTTVNLNGGTVNSVNVYVSAFARGGDGGRVSTFGGPISYTPSAGDVDPVGGDAEGGTALVRLIDPVIGSGITVDASAAGGEGGSILNGYAGGSARGGLAEAIISGTGGGNARLNISSVGRGGLGGQAVHGNGGDGGDGQGGTSRLTIATGGTFEIDQDTALESVGVGGQGRSGSDRSQFGYEAVTTGFDGGDGGEGTGGTVELVATDSNVDLVFNGGEGQIFSNNGIGGFGGNGTTPTGGSETNEPTFGGDGGDGGSGFGGTTILRAVGGELSTTNGATVEIESIGTQGFGGNGGTGNITSVTDPVTGEVTFFGADGLNGNSGFSFGGAVRVEAQDSEDGLGLVNLAGLSVDVSGDFGGRVELIDDSSGPGIALGAFDMVNGSNGFSFCGALPLCGSGLYVSSRDGAITIGGTVDLELVGGFQVDAVGTGGLDVAGDLSVIVGLDIIARHDGREDSATIAASSIVFGGGPIDLQTGTLVRSRTGSIDLTSGLFINFDKLDSALDVYLDAVGDIAGTDLASEFVVTALSDGAIDIESIFAGDYANINAGGALRVGDLTTRSGYADLIGNGVTLDTANVGTGLRVLAQNGDAVIGTTTSGAATEINSLLNIRVGSITTTNARIDPRNPGLGATILLNAAGTVTLGNLSSADGVAITADNLDQSSSNSGTLPGASSITAVGAISIGTALDIDFGSADGASISLFTTGGDIRFGTTTSDVDTSMTATVGSITGNFVTTDDGDATLTAGNAIGLDNADVGDVLSLTAGLGGITLGTSVSGYDTLIDSDGNVSIVSATTTDIGATAPTSTANIVIDAAGNVDAANLSSAENISITATALTNATSSIVAAGNVSIDVDASALFGTLTAGSMLVDAGNGISFGSSSTTGSTSLIAGTGVDGDSLVSSNGGVSVTSSGGVVDIGTASALFDLAVSNSGGGVTLGSATSTQSGIFIDASGAVEILTASSAGQFEVSSDADIVIGTATSFGDTILDAGTTITVTSLTTTGQTSSSSSAPTNAMIRLTADGDITIGALDSVGDVAINGDKLLSGIGGGAAPAGSSILAGGDIAISTIQAVQFGLADADGNVTISTGDALGFTTISAGQSVSVTAGTIIAATSLIEAGADVSVSTSGDAGLGDIDGAFVLIDSGNGISFSDITASDGASLFAEQDILGGSIAVANASLAVTSAEGGIAILTSSAAANASFSAFTDVTLASLTVTDGSASVDAGGDISIDLGDVAGAFASDSGGNTLIGTLTSGGASAITADGNIDIVSLTTGFSGGGQGGVIAVPADISITALGNVTLGELDSANDIIIDATALFGDTSIITAAGDVSLLLDTSASFGTLDAGSLVGTAGTGIDFTRATTTGTNSLGAGTGITGGTQTSSGGSVFAVTSGGFIGIDSIIAGVDATVTNFGGGVTLGSVTTQSGDILVDATEGVEIANANSAGQFEIFSDADIAVGTATSFGDTIFDAGTTITVTSLTTTGLSSSNTNAAIRLTAVGDVTIGTLDALGSASIDAANLLMAPSGGETPASSSIFAGEQIGIIVDNDATFGLADAGGTVSIDAGGTLSFATILAGGSAFIDAGLISAASSTVDADLNIFIDNDAESALGTLIGGFVSVVSDVGITFDTITGTDGASLFAQNDINGGTISTPGGTLSVTSAQGGIAITTASSGNNAFFQADSDITLGSLTVDAGSAFVDAIGNIRVDLGVVADAFVSTSGGNTTIGTLTSGGTSSIDADGDILIGRLTTTGLGGSQNSSAPSGANILLDAGGTVSLGAIDSAEEISITAASLTGTDSSIAAAGFISIDTSGAARFGTLDGDNGASIITGSTLDFASSTTIGSTTIDAGGAVTGGALRSEFGILDLTTDVGNLTLDSAYAGRAVDFNIGGDVRIAGALTVAAPQSEQVNSALIRADGDVVIDNGNIGGGLTVNSGGHVAFANAFEVAGDADITAGQTISVAGFTATQSTATSSTPALAGNIRLDAGSTLTLNGTVSAVGNVSLLADDIAAAERLVQAGGNITVFGDDDVVLGSLDGAFVSVRSNETITFADILARNGTNIFAEQDIAGGSIDTGGNLSVTSAEGGIALTSAAADFDASFFAGTDIGIGQLLTDFGAASANAEGDIRIDSGSVSSSFTSVSGEDTTIGDLTSGGPASIEADNDIFITRLTTTGLGGGHNSSAPVSANIGLNAGGDVTLGRLDSAASITLEATNLLNGDGSEDTLASSIFASGDVFITTSNNASFGSLNAGFASIDTGGSLDFGSSATAGSTVISSGGDVTGGSLTSDFSSLNVLSQTGDIDIDTVGAEGNIVFTALQGQVSGNFAEAHFGTILIDAGTVDYGELHAAGTILVRAAGDVAIDFAQTNGEGGSDDEGRNNSLPGFAGGTDAIAVPAGSDIIVNAGGNVALGEFNSAEDIIIDAASLSGSESALTAEGKIDIDVTGNAQFGSLTAAGSEILVDAGGTITGALVNAKGAGSATRLTGNDGVTIATIRAPGTLEVRASEGAILVSDLQAGSAIVSGESADVTTTAATLFTLAQATAGALTVRGTAGTLTLSDARASGALTASSSNGALVVGTAQAASIALQSDTTATLNGAVTAAGALTADVRGTATVSGVTSGATIAIASGDIVIGATARIGTAGTTTELRLTNSNNGRQTFIGGADTTAGYSLSATELSRLFSGNITVRGSSFENHEARASAAPGTATIAPSGNPNVVIDSFTLTGGAASGGNLGANGTFRIEAPGFARVIGTATLNNLSNDNRFVISAERAVQVIVGQGAIRLNGVNGLAGTLLFDADDVVVATASAISDIAGLTDTAAIDERLAQNDGILSDEGALSAGTIAFAVDNGVYVQNSGNGDGFDDRRGFTAGAGGVDIVTRQSTSSQSSPRIVINGRIAGENGTFLTGTSVFPRVTINDVALTGESQLVSGIDQGSTLNGCLIASASNCFALEVDIIPPVQDNPLVNEEDEESEQSEGEDTLSVTTVIEVTDLDPLPNEPLIDDPVTGSPNDDLWVPAGE